MTTGSLTGSGVSNLIVEFQNEELHLSSWWQSGMQDPLGFPGFPAFGSDTRSEDDAPLALPVAFV